MLQNRHFHYRRGVAAPTAEPAAPPSSAAVPTATGAVRSLQAPPDQEAHTEYESLPLLPPRGNNSAPPPPAATSQAATLPLVRVTATTAESVNTEESEPDAARVQVLDDMRVYFANRSGWYTMPLMVPVPLGRELVPATTEMRRT